MKGGPIWEDFMKVQGVIALSLVAALSGCSTTRKAVGGSSGRSGSEFQLATLRRAARYPWLDGGRCAVEASPSGWEMVAKRCYHQLGECAR